MLMQSTSRFVAFVVVLVMLFRTYSALYLKQFNSIRSSSISRSSSSSITARFNRAVSHSCVSKRSSIVSSRFSRFFSIAAFALSSTRLSAQAYSTSSSAAAMASTPPTVPKEYFRKDYKSSDYLIDEINLDFQLSAVDTLVTTTSNISRSSTSSGADLVLDGEELDLLELLIDNIVVPKDKYSYVKDKLIIAADVTSSSFVLTTKVKLHPEKNLALSGLYASGSSLLCTQCEAMGFRRITFHLDRPDVLSRYKVRLEGDKSVHPILLSNGNNIDSGELDNNRHFSVWEDPFPKPSYLFALVAGDLGSIHSEYTTTSGRVVKLGIYSDKENAGKLEHAMDSIKQSMKWDEDTFGLECDLDIYNIVATNDFNMGAMENKGLNIFNSAYVLAQSSTATDGDYERILGVIAHEYFHNWTGNRVTVRDWFQLTLKEGLTVFRDQWFTSDATSHAVKRIEDVRGLRGRQFQEDQGPMAHPIRPESYISMDNFYTGTVYIKGAEVVRMYRTLLGEQGFKKGMELYFKRHDGGAVTCDDFRAAMADANNVDLTQFERWYFQAGTPIVDVTEQYDAVSKKHSIHIKQHTPATPGQPAEEKLPLVIPIVTGLLHPDTGVEIVPSTVLKLTENEQTFHFDDVEVKPILSILRDFSAPVKLNLHQTDSELAFIMAHDTDSFNRWDAGNRLSSKLILSLAKLPIDEIKATPLPIEFVNAIKTILTTCTSSGSDDSLIAYALQLPDLITLSQSMDVIDFDRLNAAREYVKNALVTVLEGEFTTVYKHTLAKSSEYKFTPEEVGRRRLHNTCLDYLTSAGSAAAVALAKEQFDTANCMSDKLSAISCLVSIDCPEREVALTKFHADAAGDALVTNKWFAIQAMADVPDILQRVRALKSHKDFVISNPNRARSLISTFAANMPHFHASDGEGYKFIADCVIELDALNPQVASRLTSSFSQWRKFDANRQASMKGELERIKNSPNLSKDTFEVVTRCLK